MPATRTLKVFASHDWGIEAGNHSRVRSVVEALRARSVEVWFDETHMRGNILDAMCKGIDESDVVLVFVTRNYLAKVASGKAADNVRREFMYAKDRPEKIVVVRFDAQLPPTWSGPVGMLLGSQLYVDLASTFGAGLCGGPAAEAGVDALVEACRSCHASRVATVRDAFSRAAFPKPQRGTAAFASPSVLSLAPPPAAAQPLARRPSTAAGFGGGSAPRTPPTFRVGGGSPPGGGGGRQACAAWPSPVAAKAALASPTTAAPLAVRGCGVRGRVDRVLAELGDALRPGEHLAEAVQRLMESLVRVTPTPSDRDSPRETTTPSRRSESPPTPLHVKLDLIEHELGLALCT